MRFRKFVAEKAKIIAKSRAGYFRKPKKKIFWPGNKKWCLRVVLYVVNVIVKIENK